MPRSSRTPAAVRRDSVFFRRLLLAITPLGVAIGLYEAWHLAGRLVLLLAFQFLVLAGVTVMIVRRMRRESRDSR